MPATQTLFDEEFLKKLEYLSVVSKRLFAGQMRAERRTRKRGAGLEFADYRGYVPGDDFRYLDWKVYLRLDRLILRLFEEEEDLPIYMFLDTSQSMVYGNPSKLDYARRVAAALTYVGLANLDRVTLVSYTSSIQSELPPQRGKGRIFKVFRFLSEIEGGGDTNAREAFKMFCTDTRRRGLAVVISDFFDPNGYEEALNVLRYFRHDVFAVHVLSPEDVRPKLRGELLLVDSENKNAREITITAGLLSAYDQKFNEFCEQLEGYCSKYGAGYVRTITDFPFEELILKVFRQGRFLK